MSQRQDRAVQQQFGPSAAAYVASPGHPGGDDLQQLLAWGRARRPAAVLDVATGGGHTAVAFAGLEAAVVAYDLTEPMGRGRPGCERGHAGVRSR